jgi:hypothetical protein
MMSHEIEKRLDSQCIISYTVDTPILNLTRNLEFMCNTAIVFKEDVVRNYYFVPANIENERDVRIFLAETKARKNDGFWSVYSDSTMFSELTIFKDLVSIPSVTIDDVFLKDGRFNISFRFHSTDRIKLTNFIFKCNESLGDLSIEYLGKNNGVAHLSNMLGKADENVVVTIFMFPPQKYIDDREDNADLQWIREIRFHSGGDIIHGIYYGDKNWKPRGKVTPVSESDGIYVGSNHNPVIQESNKIFVEHMIFPKSRVHKFDGKKLTEEIVVTTFQLGLVQDLVSRIAGKFPDWRISLAGVRRYIET